MRSVQKALYGSLVAVILLAACFSAFNYLGDYVGQPSSNLSKCGWTRVGLDANGDGLFTYRDLFSWLVAIYVNTVKQFSAVISGSSVGQFLEVHSTACLSATLHGIASLAIGSAYIAMSYVTLKLTKFVIAVRDSRLSKKSKSASNVHHFSMRGPLEGVWAVQLPLSLTTLVVVVVVGVFGSRSQNAAERNSQSGPDIPRVESKAKEKFKNEKSQAAAQARSKQGNSEQPQRRASGATDQHLESRATQSRQERPEPAINPLQKPRPVDKQTPPNAARAEALKAEQHRQEQLAEAERQQANASRAEALKAAQQRQEQLAEAERHRQTQQREADQARVEAVRRQFEARCNLDLIDAREQARARYLNQCRNSAGGANANPFTAAASIICTLSVDDKTEQYAQTVYRACMSGAPN